jgi:hypothetical protein
MAANEPKPAGEAPLHDELVQHLLRCMEKAGMEIGAASAAGYGRPAPVTRLGLRPRRWRPDVVARDGRRAVFGAAMTEDELAGSKAGDRLGTLSRNCRTLILCIPADVEEEAVETMLRGSDMPHAKGRLLRYPRETWEELPKSADPRRTR